jgi:hypothetical protein
MDHAAAVAATIAAIPSECAATAVAYVDPIPVDAGEVILVDRRPEPVGVAVRLGYVDCEAGRNWGHRCVLVRVPVDGGAVIVTETTLPPTVEGGGRDFQVVAVGGAVPAWAVAGRS